MEEELKANFDNISIELIRGGGGVFEGCGLHGGGLLFVLAVVAGVEDSADQLAEILLHGSGSFFG